MLSVAVDGQFNARAWDFTEEGAEYEFVHDRQLGVDPGLGCQFQQHAFYSASSMRTRIELPAMKEIHHGRRQLIDDITGKQPKNPQPGYDLITKPLQIIVGKRGRATCHHAGVCPRNADARRIRLATSPNAAGWVTPCGWGAAAVRRGEMVFDTLTRRPEGCPLVAASFFSLSDASASRSARDTIARRTLLASGCPEPDRTPAAARREAIWLQLAPDARSSRNNGRKSRMTGCIARRPSGPSSATANRPASFSAVFFVIMQSGCHAALPAATARNNPQRFLATKALRFVAIRYRLFHSHLCICG
ncbi:hypothetical protein [Aminobacter sp. J44]|uniref:hypothetical protein n=1 Tax=Aminobacter sp. J44 TaxID=935262 RepID=UPI0011A2F30F|nr:hypothetical protein [Aminobacter sp. J44]